MVCARALSSAGLGGEEGPVGEALREGSGAALSPERRGRGRRLRGAFGRGTDFGFYTETGTMRDSERKSDTTRVRF